MLLGNCSSILSPRLCLLIRSTSCFHAVVSHSTSSIPGVVHCSTKLHPCSDAKPEYDRHGWRKCRLCKEQLSVDRHGWSLSHFRVLRDTCTFPVQWRKCRKCRNNFQPVLPVHKSHLRATMGTKHGIDFTDFMDQSCPASFGYTGEVSINRRFNYIENCMKL